MRKELETNGRSYCRSFPDTFDKAEGSSVFNTSGRRYIDFLSGCSSLNYGHNHPDMQKALLTYIQNQGITMSLDMGTQSKNKFMELFSKYILQPRGFDYKLQFAGPTGTNAIEAAIKLARKFTGRTNVIAFTNAFHGCSLGALALTGNQHHRNNSTALLAHTIRVPYDGYWGSEIDTSEHLKKLFSDASSGYDLPAAIIVETIQGEGGLNVATAEWMKNIESLARELGALLIIDDIQAGCGRSGDFFSFESLGVYPDIVCLAKSLSGFGLPMSLVLMKPEYDIWQPGEHSGTFRGNNLAFVTASKAIELFWCNNSFQQDIHARGKKIKSFLDGLSQTYPDATLVKGRGMMMGLKFFDSEQAKIIQKSCFSKGLIIELCGPNDEVLKLLPPLNIDAKDLEQGLNIIDAVTNDTLGRSKPACL
ncbi:MAG: diaminobutyrate--2-oxoglutarate transaminase [Candidatus Halichondribacter symbioticus]